MWVASFLDFACRIGTNAIKFYFANMAVIAHMFVFWKLSGAFLMEFRWFMTDFVIPVSWEWIRNESMCKHDCYLSVESCLCLCNKFRGQVTRFSVICGITYLSVEGVCWRNLKSVGNFLTCVKSFLHVPRLKRSVAWLFKSVARQQLQTCYMCWIIHTKISVLV